MADLASRAEWEARLARANGRLGQQALNKIMDALGDPPSAANITLAMWEELSTAQLEVLVPVLRDIYLESAKQMLDDSPIGVDWALVNKDAIEWSQKYGFELVSGINETSRQGLRAAVGNFFSEQWTMGDLRGALEGTFGPVRAELIAATEVTRAAVQGELDVVRGIAEQGIQMVAVWATSNDELVCPICGPLNGQQEDEPGSNTWTHPETGVVYGPPPDPHPRDRCWVNHEFAEAE